jgi:microcystin-dependent protein
MTEPFLGQLMICSFEFAPRGWAQCNGQLLPIAQNQALFSLLGTQFGGNGTTNFALPDLRGRTPVGALGTVQMGQSGGLENVTLLASQMPQHTHALLGSGVRATSPDPTGRTFAVRRSTPGYAAAPDSLSPTTLAFAGGSQPHPNVQPYLTINYCIALSGIFPSRN